MRTTHLRMVAGGMLLALAAAACSSSGGGGGGGGASAPGVTSNSITIGSTQPLTGIAAPGYSEIAPAAKAYFDYVNANGGVNGRQIIYKYLDDGYNPAMTVSQTQKLILQDKVFAIFNGLGTQTHLKVVDTLNSQKIPDLFVASGCLCWNDPTKYPYTFGWQVDYTVEGKILGQYIKQHFAGKKIAYFYQNDDFGLDGVKGLDKEIPASMVVKRVPYQATNINIGPLVSQLQQSGADVVVSFSVPAFTALLRLHMLQLNYNAQLAVSNVGADPITLAGMLQAFSKQGGHQVPGGPLIQGIISDYYLPTAADVGNSWYLLFKKIHDQYIKNLPLDGNVEYGMASAYTFVQALQAAGQNPTRDGIVKAIEKGGFTGPGLVPFRFSPTSHAGFTGTQIGVIQGDTIKLQGTPLTTDDGDGPITPYTATQQPAPSNGIPSNG